MAEVPRKTIVLDNGSSTLRVGFAGDERPRYITPTVLGRPDGSAGKGFMCCFNSLKDSYVGTEAQSRRDALTLTYPVERGIVQDWDDMQIIWGEAFDQIGADTEMHSILVSQPYLKRKSNRKMLVQVMFESFKSPALSVAMSGVLAMYATCRTNGIVLECGDGVCQTVPVKECIPIYDAIQRFELAGRDLTDYLIRMLDQRGYYFCPIYDRQTVDEIKETLCTVALDYAKDIKEIANTSKILEKSHKLPDGQIVKLGAERFLCPEALFEPVHVGIDEFGIQQTIHDAIMKCDTELRKHLFSNIILSGASTMFQGFADRLRQEVVALVPQHTPVNVISLPERKLHTWIGGSVMASLSTFPQTWITKREYEESGPSVVYRKNVL